MTSKTTPKKAKAMLIIVDIIKEDYKAKINDINQRLADEGLDTYNTKFIGNVKTRWKNKSLNLEKLQVIADGETVKTKKKKFNKFTTEPMVKDVVPGDVVDVSFVKRLLVSEFLEDSDKITTLKEYFEIEIETEEV